eukprot:g773.t1
MDTAGLIHLLGVLAIVGHSTTAATQYTTCQSDIPCESDRDCISGLANQAGTGCDHCSVVPGSPTKLCRAWGCGAGMDAPRCENTGQCISFYAQRGCAKCQEGACVHAPGIPIDVLDPKDDDGTTTAAPVPSMIGASPTIIAALSCVAGLIIAGVTYHHYGRSAPAAGAHEPESPSPGAWRLRKAERDRMIEDRHMRLIEDDRLANPGDHGDRRADFTRSIEGAALREI